MDLVVAVVMLVGFSLAAVAPFGLREWAERDVAKTQERLRSSGEKNPYIRLDTNPARFVRRVRFGSALAAAMSAALLLLVVI